MKDNIRLAIPPGVTTTQTSPDFQNLNARGVAVVLTVTANPGGLGSVTLSIAAKDPTSGTYFTLLTGAPVTTVSSNRYRVHPEIPAAANVAARDVLPAFWRIQVVANTASPITYSVGAATLN